MLALLRFIVNGCLVSLFTAFIYFFIFPLEEQYDTLDYFVENYKELYDFITGDIVAQGCEGSSDRLFRLIFVLVFSVSFFYYTISYILCNLFYEKIRKFILNNKLFVQEEAEKNIENGFWVTIKKWLFYLFGLIIDLSLLSVISSIYVHIDRGVSDWLGEYIVFSVIWGIVFIIVGYMIGCVPSIIGRGLLKRLDSLLED